jgi:micrococcal nuclease
MRLLSLTLATALLLSGLAGCDGEESGACPGGFSATVLQVTDGDTIKVDGFDEKVRLLGIDTPETNGTNPQDCPLPWDNMTPEEQGQYMDTCCYGEQAKAMLEFVLPIGTEVCLVNPEGGDLAKGVYGRYLADVYLEDGSWLNGKMVGGGYARANTSFPHPTRFEELKTLQAQAENGGAGMWGFCTTPDPGEGPCD